MNAFLKQHPNVREGIQTFGGGEIFKVKVVYSFHAFYMGTKAYLDNMDPTLLTSTDRIFNANETGFSICPKTKNVIG